MNIKLVSCTRHVNFLSDYKKYSFKKDIYVVKYTFIVWMAKITNSRCIWNIYFANLSFKTWMIDQNLSDIKRINIKLQSWHSSVVTFTFFSSTIFDSVALLHAKNCSFPCNCRRWIYFISSAMLQKFATMEKMLYLTFLSWNKSAPSELEPILGI